MRKSWRLGRGRSDEIDGKAEVGGGNDIHDHALYIISGSGTAPAPSSNDGHSGSSTVAATRIYSRICNNDTS